MGIFAKQKRSTVLLYLIILLTITVKTYSLETEPMLRRESVFVRHSPSFNTNSLRSRFLNSGVGHGSHHDNGNAENAQQPDNGQQEMNPQQNIEPDNRDDPNAPHYFYYTEGYYVDPCDTNDPHVYDKPECSYLRPTEEPTLSPTTENPTQMPTGSPTFEPRIDFSISQVSVLMASDGFRDAHFGHAVDLYYHTAAVGAYAEGTGGSAYVFQLENIRGGSGLKWNQVGIVSSPDSEEDDYYGFAVSLRNNTLYVGAYKSDLTLSASGAVYVYNQNEETGLYALETTLSSFIPATNEFFGFALSSWDTFLLVGAYGNNDKGTDAGIVYVFQYQSTTNSYTNFARLYATDASSYDAFGSSVDYHGDYAVIGAHGDETRGTASGSAYIFFYNSGSKAWAQEAKLTGSGVGAHDYFGYSVGIHNDLVLVGAYHGDGIVETSGVVYVFMQTTRKATQGVSQMSGWYEVTILYPKDGSASSYFGYSVSVYNNLAIIGAPGDDTLANAAGSAYVYEAGYHHWQMSFKLYGKGSQYDSFGCAVAVFGRIGLVGSLLGDGVTTDTGSAFTFTPKDEFTVPVQHSRKQQSIESRLKSKIYALEDEAKQAKPLELLAAIGFLCATIMLFFYLILWIRKNRQPETKIVTIVPMHHHYRDVNSETPPTSLHGDRRSSASTHLSPGSSGYPATPATPKHRSSSTSGSSTSREKSKSSSSKKKKGISFGELPSDSSHSTISLDSSSSKLLNERSSHSNKSKSAGTGTGTGGGSSHAGGSGGGFGSTISSFFSFGKSSGVTASSGNNTNTVTVRRDRDDASSDNGSQIEEADLLEGQMSISRDGMLDAKDKKKKKKLKMVELARL